MPWMRCCCRWHRALGLPAAERGQDGSQSAASRQGVCQRPASPRSARLPTRQSPCTELLLHAVPLHPLLLAPASARCLRSCNLAVLTAPANGAAAPRPVRACEEACPNLRRRPRDLWENVGRVWGEPYGPRAMQRDGAFQGLGPRARTLSSAACKRADADPHSFKDPVSHPVASPAFRNPDRPTRRRAGALRHSQVAWRATRECRLAPPAAQ